MITFIVYIEQAFRNFGYRLKGNCFKWYLLVHGCQAGKRLKCMGFPKFRSIPKKNIVIGNDVTLGRNVTFEITNEGKLILGNNTLFI